MNNENKTWGVGLCHYTGELIQDGFYLQLHDVYFSTEELLVKYLREIDTDTNIEGQPLTDEFLLEDWYNKDTDDGGYYYSEWDPEHAKYLKIDGQLFEIEIRDIL